MGLLDSLGGAAGAATAGQSGDPKAALVQAVLGMLTHGNEPGGLGGSGGFGGLAGLLQRFQGAGLGDAVASWIGPGANTAISSDQVRTALGDGPLRTLAEHAGVDEHVAATHLSTLLPAIVDRLTPDGRLPPENLHPDGIGGAIASLGHLFGDRPA